MTVLLGRKSSESEVSSSTVHWDLNHSEQNVPQDLQHVLSPRAHWDAKSLFSFRVGGPKILQCILHIIYSILISSQAMKIILSINDACFVVVSTSHPPPLETQLLRLRRYRSGAILKATSKVWFSKGSPLAPGSQKMWPGAKHGGSMLIFKKNGFPGKSG